MGRVGKSQLETGVNVKIYPSEIHWQGETANEQFPSPVYSWQPLLTTTLSSSLNMAWSTCHPLCKCCSMYDMMGVGGEIHNWRIKKITAARQSCDLDLDDATGARKNARILNILARMGAQGGIDILVLRTKVWIDDSCTRTSKKMIDSYKRLAEKIAEPCTLNTLLLT